MILMMLPCFGRERAPKLACPEHMHVTVAEAAIWVDTVCKVRQGKIMGRAASTAPL